MEFMKNFAFVSIAEYRFGRILITFSHPGTISVAPKQAKLKTGSG